MDLVKVSLRFRETDELPIWESMWANRSRLAATAGAYELANTSPSQASPRRPSRKRSPFCVDTAAGLPTSSAN